jgi:hypothetical protein
LEDLARDSVPECNLRDLRISLCLITFAYEDPSFLGDKGLGDNSLDEVLEGL